MIRSVLPLLANMDVKQVPDYRIESIVGEGPSGTVYCGTELSSGQQVAVKILNAPPGQSQLIADSTYRENLKKISHPAIGRILDFAEIDGKLAIVEELINGVSLEKILLEHRSIHPSPGEVGLAVTSALETFHTAGVVHANLKPSNIFVSHTGDVMVTDAGLNPSVTQAELEGLREPASWMSYLAPEQVRNGEPTAQTDLYQLGVVLYELAYGRKAFASPDPKILVKNILDLKPPLDTFTDLPGDWVLALGKLLSKSPADRFAGAAELRVNFEAMVQFDGQPIELAGRAKHTASPRQYFMLSVLAALLLILWFVVTTYR